MKDPILVVFLIIIVIALVYMLWPHKKVVLPLASRSRYSREVKRFIDKSHYDDSYGTAELSKDIWSARPNIILTNKLYELTVAGGLKWHVGNVPVFHLNIEKNGENVHFEIRKYIDPNERKGSKNTVALSVQVGGEPDISIECIYTSDENRIHFPALVKLYDYLVENYPLNPSIGFGRNRHLKETEAIILEKATDIITSV